MELVLRLFVQKIFDRLVMHNDDEQNTIHFTLLSSWIDFMSLCINNSHMPVQVYFGTSRISVASYIICTTDIVILIIEKHLLYILI